MRQQRAGRFDEAGEAVDIGHEATLAGRRWRAAEIGVRVEYRKQCQPDSRFVGGGDDARGGRGGVGIAAAVDIVVEIMELADARVASLEHLDIGERGDRSEEHTSELQSLMRISYAVFCLKKKKT